MTKIEEVARAIISALRDGCTGEDLARAAIEAMREPSAEMIERMSLDWEACHEDGPGEECKTGIHVWRAGINAALNEGRE